MEQLFGQGRLEPAVKAQSANHCLARSTPKCFSRGIQSWRKGEASGRRRQAAATDRQDHEGGAEISRRDWCSYLDEIREISAGDQNAGRHQTRQLRESIFGGAHFRRDIAAKAF